MGLEEPWVGAGVLFAFICMVIGSRESSKSAGVLVTMVQQVWVRSLECRFSFVNLYSCPQAVWTQGPLRSGVFVQNHTLGVQRQERALGSMCSMGLIRHTSPLPASPSALLNLRY